MSQGPAPSSPSATIHNLRSPGSRRPPNRLGKFLCSWDKINDNMHKLRGIIYEYMNSKILL